MKFGTAYTIMGLLLAGVALVRLLRDKREPSSTLAWLLFILTVPIGGAVLFLIFGPQRLQRRAIKRKKEIERRLADLSHERAEASMENTTPPPFVLDEQWQVLRLARQVSGYEMTRGNQVEILPDPVRALASMQESIDAAVSFVHLEYYLIASDEVTAQLFESLERAAKRGVQVRILYDSLGSLFLKRRYFKELIKNGARVAGFLPFSLWPQRLNFNFRNHRKILIVDGCVAFTGGTNIGKEYLGKWSDKQWRDYVVKVQGPVCLQLQDVFAKDWQFTTKEDLFVAEYYPQAKPSQAGSIVQVLESGPDSPFYTLHAALFLAITSARTEVLLTTPYFIPDSAMMSALLVAALRGITVKLLLPHKTDSRLVQFASRSFYENLLKAGIQIYEYRPQILHAKMLIVDRTWTILGSANMDIRSFRLNFELNLVAHGEAVANQAVALFEQDVGQSHVVTLKSYQARSMTEQLLENACRLLSPIL